MRYATFINFTEKPFTAYWNGRAYHFQPGDIKEHLNEAIASHFAKHLTNEYLQDPDNKIIDGEKFTSPKRPQDVPKFMEIYNKAFKLEGDGNEVDAETGLPIDGQRAEAGLPDQPSMNIRTKPREIVDPYDATAQPAVGPSGAPVVIGEIEETEEDKFEGKK